LLKRVIDNPDYRLASRIEKQIRTNIPDHYAWPGNVRELEQCIRRICLTGSYSITEASGLTTRHTGFSLPENHSESTAQHLMQRYCRFLYDRYGSYEAVARITHLDRRTVKKYIME
jgi:transcriptional regulator with GAF, ATPase, and Fis domain